MITQHNFEISSNIINDSLPLYSKLKCNKQNICPKYSSEFLINKYKYIKINDISNDVGTNYNNKTTTQHKQISDSNPQDLSSNLKCSTEKTKATTPKSLIRGTSLTLEKRSTKNYKPREIRSASNACLGRIVTDRTSICAHDNNHNIESDLSFNIDEFKTIFNNKCKVRFDGNKLNNITKVPKRLSNQVSTIKEANRQYQVNRSNSTYLVKNVKNVKNITKFTNYFSEEIKEAKPQTESEKQPAQKQNLQPCESKMKIERDFLVNKNHRLILLKKGIDRNRMKTLNSIKESTNELGHGSDLQQDENGKFENCNNGGVEKQHTPKVFSSKKVKLDINLGYLKKPIRNCGK